MAITIADAPIDSSTRAIQEADRIPFSVGLDCIYRIVTCDFLELNKSAFLAVDWFVKHEPATSVWQFGQDVCRMNDGVRTQVRVGSRVKRIRRAVAIQSFHCYTYGSAVIIGANPLSTQAGRGNERGAGATKWVKNDTIPFGCELDYPLQEFE
jgi:hypothetical protein